MTNAMTRGIELAQAAGDRAAIRNITDLKLWSNGYLKFSVTPKSPKGEEACQRFFTSDMTRCGETFYMGLHAWTALKAKLDATFTTYSH